MKRLSRLILDVLKAEAEVERLRSLPDVRKSQVESAEADHDAAEGDLVLYLRDQMREP